jgi:phosphoribosylamine--glycine ligase
VVVSGGYPEDFEKGKVISGIENIFDSIVFHAGTKTENGSVVSNGGRVLAVTSFGDDFSRSHKKIVSKYK